MHSVLQEAILRLSGVVNLEQLEEAVKDALEAALPNTVSTFIHHILLSSDVVAPLSIEIEKHRLFVFVSQVVCRIENISVNSQSNYSRKHDIEEQHIQCLRTLSWCRK